MKDARNAKRKDDIAKIKNALDMFVAEGGTIQCVAPGCTAPLPNDPFYSLNKSNMADLESRLVFVKGSATKLPNEYFPNGEFPRDPKGRFPEQDYKLMLSKSDAKWHIVMPFNAENEAIFKEY